VITIVKIPASLLSSVADFMKNITSNSPAIPTITIHNPTELQRAQLVNIFDQPFLPGSDTFSYARSPDKEPR
jgi:hypothetical protein